MFQEYIKEREGFEYADIKALDGEKVGFALYTIIKGNKECYIKDIYIKSEYRKLHYASQLADVICEIAREQQCTHLSGSVCTSVGNPTASMKVLFAYGMSFHSVKGDMIYFIKDL